MIAADAPLKELMEQLTTHRENTRRGRDVRVQWTFTLGAFLCSPVFSDSPALLLDTLGRLADLGYTRIDVRISSSSEQDGTEPDSLPKAIYEIQCSGMTNEEDKPAASLIQDICGKQQDKLFPEYRFTENGLHLRCRMLCTKIEYEGESDQNPVDLEGLKGKIDDEEMYRTMIELFRNNAPQRIGEWKAAFRSGDIREAHRIIHSLKGSALNISAIRLTRLSRRLEIALKIDHTDDAEKLLDLVEKELSRVIDYLERNAT